MAGSFLNIPIPDYQDQGGGTIFPGENYWIKNEIGIHTLSNVGVGTTAPYFNFDVEGDINYTGILYQDGVPVVFGENYWVKNEVGIHTLSNVGIGVTSPSQSLHISQNIRVEGGYYDSNDTIGTNLQVLSSTGAGTSWTTLNIPDNVGISFTASPQPPPTANPGDEWLNITSSSLFKYYIDGDTSQWVEFGPIGFAQTSNINVENYWIKNEIGIHTLSNVGVGTTAPYFNFDVEGDINYTGILYQDGVPVVFGENYWSKTQIGIHTLTNVGIGTSNSEGYKLNVHSVWEFDTTKWLLEINSNPGEYYKSQFIDIDSEKNIYVCGKIEYNSNQNYKEIILLCKFDQNQTPIYQYTLELTNNLNLGLNGSYSVKKLIVDKNDNLYLTFTFPSQTPDHTDVVVVKFDSQGNLIGDINFSTYGYDIYNTNLQTTQNGDFIISYTGYDDVKNLRFNSNGILLWQQQINDPFYIIGGNKNKNISDDNQIIFLSSQASFSSIILSVNSAGSVNWQYQIQNLFALNDYYVTENGDIYLICIIPYSNSEVIIKFNSSGNLLSSKQINIDNSLFVNSSRYRILSVDSLDNIYLAPGSTNGEYPNLIIINFSQNTQRSFYISSPGLSLENNIIIDDSNIYIINNSQYTAYVSDDYFKILKLSTITENDGNYNGVIVKSKPITVGIASTNPTISNFSSTINSETLSVSSGIGITIIQNNRTFTKFYGHIPFDSVIDSYANLKNINIEKADVRGTFKINGLEFGDSNNNNLIIGNNTIKNGKNLGYSNNIFIGDYSGYDVDTSYYLLPQNNINIGKNTGRYSTGSEKCVSIGHNSGTGQTGAITDIEIIESTVLPGQGGWQDVLDLTSIGGVHFDIRIYRSYSGAVTDWNFRGWGYGGYNFKLDDIIVIPGSTWETGVDGIDDVVLLVTGIGDSPGSDYTSVQIGADSGKNTSETFGNTFVGAYSGEYGGVASYYNTFIGSYTGQKFYSDGFNNTLIGALAGNEMTNGFYNVFVGGYSGGFLNGNSLGGTDLDTGNTALGIFSAGGLFNGNYNTYVGAFSGPQDNLPYTSINSSNSTLGAWSGTNLEKGSGNTFIGAYSGAKYRNGSNNICLGSFNNANSYIWNAGPSINSNYQISIGVGLAQTYGNYYYTSRSFELPQPNKDCQFAVGIATTTSGTYPNYWLVGDENFNIGIGTTNPTSKLTVGGDCLISGITTIGVGTETSPPDNLQMSFELINNTTLRFKVKCSDGVIRTGDLNLT